MSLKQTHKTLYLRVAKTLRTRVKKVAEGSTTEALRLAITSTPLATNAGYYTAPTGWNGYVIRFHAWPKN